CRRPGWSTITWRAASRVGARGSGRRKVCTHDALGRREDDRGRCLRNRLSDQTGGFATGGLATGGLAADVSAFGAESAGLLNCAASCCAAARCFSTTGSVALTSLRTSAFVAAGLSVLSASIAV